MYSTILLLGAAGLLVASTAHAQGPERALLSRIPTGYGIAATSPAALILDQAGERALLGRVDNSARQADSAGSTDAPIDGAGALLGKRLSRQSSFSAQVRGDVATDAAGEAEFGGVEAGDGLSPAFVVSLGIRGSQSAILFTRMNGTPLAAGRYRITDRGNGADEILALVMTGSPTSPTGVFRGSSGWLVVTAASDRLLTGRFQVDGVGFLAAEPKLEDRPVRVTGSFSALPASRS